jgi:hypothetical protein
MNCPDKFEEYVKKGIIKKQQPDFSRAGFKQRLWKMTKKVV